MNANAIGDVGMVFFNGEVVGFPALNYPRLQRETAGILIYHLLGLFIQMRRLGGVHDPLARHLLHRPVRQHDLALAAAHFEHLADLLERTIRLEIAVAGGDGRAGGEEYPFGGDIVEELGYATGDEVAVLVMGHDHCGTFNVLNFDHLPIGFTNKCSRRKTLICNRRRLSEIEFSHNSVCIRDTYQRIRPHKSVYCIKYPPF